MKKKLNTYKQGLNQKLYRLLIAKTIDNLELSVKEVERALEIDSIILQHQKLSLKAVENKYCFKIKRFFSAIFPPRIIAKTHSISNSNHQTSKTSTFCPQ